MSFKMYAVKAIMLKVSTIQCATKPLEGANSEK
jgi:hypothetical protein